MPDGTSYHLRYDAPADSWHDAMPLGNGRLGAMAYGHAGIERIQLNDDSLWYGTFHRRDDASLREELPEIRELVLAGDIYRAEELVLHYMAGTPAAMRRYTAMGELDIALNRHLPFAMGRMPDSGDAAGFEMKAIAAAKCVLSWARTAPGGRKRRVDGL